MHNIIIIVNIMIIDAYIIAAFTAAFAAAVSVVRITAAALNARVPTPAFIPVCECVCYCS